MRLRKINDPMVLETLRKGTIRREPEPDTKADGLRCVMERYVSGRQCRRSRAGRPSCTRSDSDYRDGSNEGVNIYHYTDGGLKNVWLVNGYEIRKTPDGEGVAINDLSGLGIAICLALAKKAAPLSGAEFRYVRSAGLMQSQTGLAKLLGNSDQAVARWEKSGKVPRWADKLVRLLYLAHADGQSPIAVVVERINAIERAEKQTIVLKEAKSGWASSVEKQRSDVSDCATM